MLELVEVATNHVINQIITHKIVPGSTIFETTVAESLSMSRTPVRQALNAIVSMGILEHAKGKRGYLLPALDSRDMEQVLQTRKAIESQAVAEAARNAPLDEAKAAAIAALIEEERVRIREKDRLRYAIVNGRIHAGLVDLSENVYLQRAFTPVFWRASLYDFYFSDFYSETPLIPIEYYYKDPEEHTRILQAIRSSDAEFARVGMEMHIASTLAMYKRIYKEMESRKEVAE